MLRPPALLLLVLVPALAGCSAHYGDVTRGVRELVHEGKPDEALAALEKENQEHSLDPLLVELDRGVLLRQTGRLAESVEVLNRAAALAEERETVRLSDEFFGRAPYRMSSNEKQALHALQALSYVELGRLDEAVVEARITDLRQLALQRNVDPGKEVFMTGGSLSPVLRPYLERLIFGRYISGLAHELDGNEDSAFLDYYEAWQLARSAPQDAPVSLDALTPVLLQRARALNRDAERKVLEATGAAPEAVAPGTGEAVVVIEVGHVPGRSVSGPGQPVELEPRRGPFPSATVTASTAAGSATSSQTVTSLEDLLHRRGMQGLILDTERSATIGVNTAMCISYVVLFPVMMPIVIKRGYEAGIRGLQSWRLLPAELQVARLRLPEGRHTLRIALGKESLTHDVQIRAGRPALVSVRFQGPQPTPSKD